MGIDYTALNDLRTSAEYILGKTTTHRYVVVDVFEWDNIIVRSKYERHMINASKRDSKATFSIDDIPVLKKLLNMELSDDTLICETHDVYVDSVMTRWTNARFYILKQDGLVNAYHIEFTPKRALPSIKPMELPLYIGTDIMDSTPTLAIPAVSLWNTTIFTALRNITPRTPLDYIENIPFDEMNKNTVESMIDRAKNEYKFRRCWICNKPFAVKRSDDADDILCSSRHPDLLDLI